MNLIYNDSFGHPWSDSCKDYETEVKPNLQFITTQIKLATAFFDPVYYNKNSHLILDATYSSTNLIANFG